MSSQLSLFYAKNWGLAREQSETQGHREDDCLLSVVAAEKVGGIGMHIMMNYIRLGFMVEYTEVYDLEGKESLLPIE